MAKTRVVPRGAIFVEALGDSPMFSDYGKNTSFLIYAGYKKFLIDCGANPFARLGHDGLANLGALIVTHSHDDHRRWFTEMALYRFYHPGIKLKLPVVATETVLEELCISGQSALERTLTPDRKLATETPMEEFIEQIPIGPRAKYVAAAIKLDRKGGPVWRIVERATGKIVPPEKGKVVLRNKGGRPRMLMRDEASGAWVEPENYYDFGDAAFYEADPRDFVEAETGLRFRAVKAPVWHGPSAIGLKLETSSTHLAFSGDTVYDPELWQELTAERQQNLPLSEAGFRDAAVLYGDINRFIQRVWSPERLARALAMFEGYALFHEADNEHSIVHTRHSKLLTHPTKPQVVTHVPDVFTSPYPIANRTKVYVAQGNQVREMGRQGPMPFIADIYHRDSAGNMFAGFADDAGEYGFFTDQKGNFKLLLLDDIPTKVEKRYKLYRDIDGGYYQNPKSDESLRLRPDGQVELLKSSAQGSSGSVVEDLRPMLTAKYLEQKNNAADRKAEDKNSPKRHGTHTLPA
ncbi:MAG: hypothetical protein ACREJ2_05035 [Planctomycetota bacterium]